MTDIFLKIVNMSISAGWIVLAVLIIRLLLKRAPKWINCILWGIVGLRLVMPFSLESVLSLIPSSETISKAPDSPRPYFESGLTIVDNQVNDYLKGNYFEGVSRPMGNFIDITTILGIVWTVGIVALLGYIVISYLRLRKKIGTAVLLRYNIFQSENAISPFVLGIIKPKIYLPFNMNESDMKHVIAHEQAHIKRKDHLWKPLGFLLLTVYWFNPLIWVGYILLCRDIELACDEKVVKELDTEQRADYSEALLSCSVNRRMIAACPLAFGEVGVKSRIKTVLNYKKPAFWIIIIAVIASIIVAVCFLTNPTQEAEIFTISDGYTTHDKVDIAATELMIGDKSGHIVLRWDNQTNKAISYGEEFHVYKKVFGMKLECKNDNVAWNAILYEMDGTEDERTISLNGIEIKAKGEYVLEFDFNVAGDDKEHTAYIEFKGEDEANDIQNIDVNSESLTWRYSPMLSATFHYFYPFEFDFDYTHIVATCDNGMMQNLEADDQPKALTLRFENGQHIYWTPDEAVIEKIPQISKVGITVYDGDNEIYYANIVFECVARELSSADFEIYLEESNGLILTQKEGIACFVEGKDSSIANVGGADGYSAEDSGIPKMYVVRGKTKVTAWTGTASWTYMLDNDTAQTINADSSHPLEQIDYIKPWAINIADRDEVPPVVDLKFDIVPDNIKANAWFFTENGKTKSFDPTVEGMTIKLNNSSEPCLYEVIATWNSSDKYNGTIHYAFYVTSYLIEDMSVKEIVDRAVTEGIPTDDAEQPFFVDENYIYSYPTIRSEYVIVKFNNGDEMTVQKALSKGYITISTLDEWDIEYIKKENDGSIVLAEDGTILWASSLLNSDISIELLESGSDIKDISISYKNLVLDADRPYIEVEWKNNSDNEFVFGKSFELEYLENGEFKNCAKETVSFKSIGVILPAETTKTEKYNLSQFNLSNEGTYRFKVRRYENNYLWFDFKISKK